MSKGKILYVGGFELPDKNAAAHRVIANGKIFRDLGYEIDFLGIDKSKQDNVGFINNKKNYGGFKYWSISYPKSTLEWIKYVGSIKDIKRFLSDFKETYNCIIIYNFPAVASYKILKYCKKNNIKVIADCTEWYDHKKNSLLGIIKYLDSEIRMRYINKKLDGIICISEYLYKYYRDIRNKVVLTPLVDLQDKKWQMMDINKNNIVKLIYAGSPGLDKDKINLVIDSLIKIYNINNKVLLNIIGIKRDEYFDNYPEHRTESTLIDEFTIFHGRIPHRNAVDLIKSSDFTIFLREKTRANMAGFPTKFVESISCGTPVLTNNTSDLEKYLVDGKNGFWINIEDENARIKELKKIIALPRDKIDTMKKFSRESKMFDYRRNIKLIDIFMENII